MLDGIAGDARAARMSPPAVTVVGDVVDLRDLARQEGAGGRLAFLADGSLVAWSMTAESPAATKEAATLTA